MLTPTSEQAAIIEMSVKTNDSILISALAGSAKTTTLLLICKALPTTLPILSLAFNKRIQQEMEKRLPSNVLSKTLNSIGHSTWATAIGRRLNVNPKKNYETLKAKYDAIPRSSRNGLEFAEILGTIRLAKSAGYIPNGKYPSARRIITQDDFYANLEETPSGEAINLIEAVLTEGIKAGYSGSIDFDDQIYLPSLFGGTFPQFPLVMVDEAQDLSALNHAMLEKLVTKRIIAVGDPWQSIYAFRGADTASMARLRTRFSMKDMGLSISFRCPESIVRRARTRAPHMKWAPGAPPGRIEVLNQWNPGDIPDGAAIICRNNAPLFNLALSLLKAGRGCQLVGSDLGPSLARVLKRLGPESMAQHEVFFAINRWESERLEKAKSPGAIIDKADCLRVFAGFGDTLGKAITYAEHLFASKGPIQLLSGHKAKGLEWDSVFHLDPWRIPSKWAVKDEDKEQEMNVRYVIETRPRKELFLVTMDGFHV